MNAKRLAERHPTQDLSDLSLFDDLYKGGVQFHANIDRYIKARPYEQAEFTKARKENAFYIPYGAALVDYFTANLFVGRTSIKRVDREPLSEDWTAFISDVDGRGKDWDFFWRKAFTRAQIDQWDLISPVFPKPDPNAPPATSKGEQLKAGLLRPYLTLIKRQDVCDWEKDEIGRPVWTTLEWKCRERPSPDAPRQKTGEETTRWTLVTRKTIAEFKRAAGKTGAIADDEAAEVGDVKETPIYPLVELKIPNGAWIMGQTATLLLALFRKWNDYAWALSQGAYPMPLVYKKGAFLQTQGEGYIWQFEDRRTEGAEMLEPSGSAYAALAADLASLKDELHRVTHQMALSLSNAAVSAGRSGESKMRDHLPTLIILKAYGAIVREKMEETLNLLAAIRGDTDKDGKPLKFSVSGLDEFDVEDLATFLNNAVLLGTINIPSPTFQKCLRKTAAIKALPSEAEAIKDQIRAEIDAAPAVAGPQFKPGDSPFMPEKEEGEGKEEAGEAEDEEDEAAENEAGDEDEETAAAGKNGQTYAPGRIRK